jgi:hypothetical protein
MLLIPVLRLSFSLGFNNTSRSCLLFPHAQLYIKHYTERIF